MGQFVRFLIGIFLFNSVAVAEKVTGRINFGSYMATERFSNALSGSDTNDFQFFSTRYFMKVEEVGSGKWELTMDLRDKYDFFNKLDKEILALTGNNFFQAREFSGKKNLGESSSLEIGRFPLIEAGSAYVDGLEYENKWGARSRSGYFVGLNPKKEGRPYLESDPKASTVGAYFTYEDSKGNWDKNLYLSHALVQQIYDGNTDRFYLFHSGHYQWAEDSRLLSLIYLDFVPRMKAETASVTWQNAWGKSVSTELGYTGVDVIEYSRRAGLLETLSASPYNEVSATVHFLYGHEDKYYLKYLSGVRAIDSLAKTQAIVGLVKSPFYSKNMDFNGALGTRQNFTSTDSILKASCTYFTRKWETSLDADFETHSNVNGTTTHPVILEGSYAHFLSKQLYTILSAQSASDESVTIYSVYFKLGYRFGSQEIPPIRDGAPPRGAL